MSTWLSITLAVLGGMLLFWLLTFAALALALARPRGNLLTEAARLLPDLLRLIPRLARDQALPRGVRVRLWLLLAYLAMPIDLIPDFIPVLGYADDAIVVVAVLCSVVRHAGADALARHWPGTDDGLIAVRRLTNLPATPNP
ncbi:YkvA family protein [Streptomyces sp. JNUCC 63]